MSADDSFYVGYLDRAPATTARFVRRIVFGVLAGGLAVAGGVAWAQSRLPLATFEFGTSQSFEGTIDTIPVPTLVVPLDGTNEGHTDVTRLALVAAGKHGADDQISGHHHEPVTVEGTLIYRDGQTMLELADGTLAVSPTATPVLASPPESLGRVTLQGEIVDAKCYLGVMVPGETTTHRACAVRCLSGGVPPMLALRDSLGLTASVWLTGMGGAPLGEAVLPFVAEPIEVTGVLWKFDNQLVLELDPAALNHKALIQ
jgi:hypothetical protein